MKIFHFLQIRRVAHACVFSNSMAGVRQKTRRTVTWARTVTSVGGRTTPRLDTACAFFFPHSRGATMGKTTPLADSQQSVILQDMGDATGRLSPCRLVRGGLFCSPKCGETCQRACLRLAIIRAEP